MLQDSVVKIFTAVEKVNHYYRGLKLPICDEMLEQLLHMLCSVYYNFIDTRRISAAGHRGSRS